MACHTSHFYLAHLHACKLADAAVGRYQTWEGRQKHALHTFTSVHLCR